MTRAAYILAGAVLAPVAVIAGLLVVDQIAGRLNADDVGPLLFLCALMLCGAVVGNDMWRDRQRGGR